MKKQMSASSIRDSKGDRLFYAVCYIISIFLVLIVLYPIIYVVSCSFSSGYAVSTGKVVLWPVEFSVTGYKRVFNYNGIWRSYLNTIYYTVAHTFLHVALVFTCAYPLAKRGLPHKKFFMVFFTITMMFSGGIIPTYLLFRSLKLLNKPLAVIISGCFSCYNMSVCRSFIQNSIPGELWEATEIDGCSPGRFFVQFVLPLSKPVIAVITMQVAIVIWNTYVTPMLYLSDAKYYPLQIILRNILIMSNVSAEEIDADASSNLQGLVEQLKYALIIVSTLPIMCLYPFAQKYFVKGMMVGSLKG